MKLTGLIAALFFLSGCSGEANPRKAETLLKMEDLGIIVDKEVQRNDPRDVSVVFDFSYTLLLPKEAALHKKNIEKYKSAFAALLEPLSKEERDRLLNDTLKSADQQLAGGGTPATIQKLKKLGVNLMVCTNSLTKTKGKSTADIIGKLLQKQGIELEFRNIPFAHSEFDEFKEYLGGYPSYDSGIITSNRSDKGLVLSAFFRRLPRTPRTVIFIDNNPQKTADVLKIADDFDDTKFVVCKYGEHENIPAPEISEREFIDFWRSKIAEMNFSRRN
ncbi:MAG: DUF2608 domain-containing protein [Holosporaceae bacterium]|jgi:hypothetical protein|nr:DUF2608 domain-containing protein [Holosporaceae bacterium]